MGSKTFLGNDRWIKSLFIGANSCSTGCKKSSTDSRYNQKSWLRDYLALGLLKNPDGDLKPPEVFKRDTNGVRKCDIFVADVSKPSHGVGMELMLAQELKKRVICVYRQDTKISWMIKGLPDATLIEYADMDDLEKKLLMELGESRLVHNQMQLP